MEETKEQEREENINLVKAKKIFLITIVKLWSRSKS